MLIQALFFVYHPKVLDVGAKRFCHPKRARENGFFLAFGGKSKNNGIDPTASDGKIVI